MWAAMRITCKECGNTLGEYFPGRVIVRHGRREIVMGISDLLSVRCERCGRIWQPDLRNGTGNGAVLDEAKNPSGAVSS